MRIATFNIWNNPSSWAERIDSICEEVTRVNPDFLALQEVKTYMNGEEGMNVARHIAQKTGFPFCVFKEYPDSPDEGLAFLSKYPISTEDAIWYTDTKESNYCAIRITFEMGDITFGLTNVHLNWRSSATREEQMKSVHDWIFEGDGTTAFEILCGDFNDDPDSPVHHYLTGHLWSDVAQLQEEQHGIKAQATLDPVDNPHLRNGSNFERPVRYDWILCQKKGENLPSIDKVDVFGNMPVTGVKILPSDHYGVFADITLEHEKETDRVSS
ncbi:endonuclease/exonuclease/phosphatase family protein [Exiguobacterium flavidum]|uniref:endonuclease/exonuclease/phosphatase family protein n=1 Tax=Exiguobacterium flavidum TaxID=2184695 RepID=UPI000DF80DDA